MAKTIDARLAKLEARANARRRLLITWVAVGSVDELSDEQLEAAARGDLTIYLGGISPDDWERDNDETT